MEEKLKLLCLLVLYLFLFDIMLATCDDSSIARRPTLEGKYKDVMFVVEKLAQETIEKEKALLEDLNTTKTSYRKMKRRSMEINYQLPLIIEEIGVVKKLIIATENLEEQAQKESIILNLKLLQSKLEEDVPILEKESLLVKETVINARNEMEKSQKEYDEGKQARHEVLRFVFFAQNLLSEIQQSNKVSMYNSLFF